MTETEQSTGTQQRPLFQPQRQDGITALAIEHGRVDVAELAERFAVTTETIRRDLSDLQDRRILRRVHGGAVPWQALRFEPLLAVRDDLQLAEKRRIGHAAVDELPDSGAIIVDSGSTTARFCEALPRERPLTVITNSILNAQVLAGFDDVDVMVLGGTLRKNTMAMVDTATVAAVEELTVDTLFISCDGMSAARGMSTPYRSEAALKRAMIRAARRVVALVDHSKLDNDQMFRFAGWSDVDVLITDTRLDEAAVESLRSLVPIVRQA